MNIDTHHYYLLVNVCCLIIPFIFSFHPKIQFYKNWNAFLLGITVMMFVFIPWDIIFTSIGIWGFNEKYTTGIFIFNLPLEEWMFFVCIPYACLFTYHCIKIITPNEPFPVFFKVFNRTILLLCVLIAVISCQKLYTFISHSFCALLLSYHLIILKSKYLNRFMLTFFIVLFPFIISNGILTGINFWEYPFVNTHADFISEKIVWYNNQHNLGVRIFSMPLDDVSYGLSMLLLSISVYEWKLKKHNLFP